MHEVITDCGYSHQGNKQGVLEGRAPILGLVGRHLS